MVKQLESSDTTANIFHNHNRHHFQQHRTDNQLQYTKPTSLLQATTLSRPITVTTNIPPTMSRIGSHGAPHHSPSPPPSSYSLPSSRDGSPRPGYLTPARAAPLPPNRGTPSRSPSPAGYPVPAGRGGYNRSVSPAPTGDFAGRGGYNAAFPGRYFPPATAQHRSSSVGSGGYHAMARAVSPAAGDYAGRGGYNATPTSTPPSRSPSRSPASVGQPVPMGRGGYNNYEHMTFPIYTPPGSSAGTSTSSRIHPRELGDGFGGRGGYNATPPSRSPNQSPVPAGRGGYNMTPPNRTPNRSPAAPEGPVPAGRGGYNRSLSMPHRREGDGMRMPSRSPSRSPAAPQTIYPAGRGGYNSSLP